MPEPKSKSEQHRAALATWRDSRSRRFLVGVTVLLACASLFGPVVAQDAPRRGSPTTEASNQPTSIEVPEGLAAGPQHWTSPEGLSATIQVMLLLTVLSLAPAVLLMTTCFVRIIVVLGLLRQAIGTQQLPPSQVITAMALFITLLIMSPVWKQVYDDAIMPYTEKQIGLEEAWTKGVAPIRKFMGMQIDRTNNSDDVWLFMSYLPDHAEPETYDDVPLQALLPAFMLSELKTAFLIGFQVYLPFLILDMVIAAVMVSMGMLMLPPVLISLPFKLLLFVLVDGWHLVVGMLMESFAPFT
jgi:flagellar biosynthetic protein FliP